MSTSKILFSGCSFVMGDEVERHERFSHIVCDMLDVEEYNIAGGGRSNSLSAILAITEAEKVNPDYIVFGITYPARAFGMINPDYSASNNDINNKLARWNNGVFENDNRTTFKITASMTNYINCPPDSDTIIKSIPHFRNELQTFIELQGIINLLINFSEQKNIPLCIFEATAVPDYPTELNNVELKDTILNYPPKHKSWLDKSLYKMAIYNNDMMPRMHPGARTHKEFAEILADKIRNEI